MGRELCAMQIIHGSTEFAVSNLNFIKDNFEFVSENKWKMLFNNKLQIDATFEREGGDYPSYTVKYELGEQD